MNKFIIWDKNGQYDLALSTQLGLSWFGDNEVISQPELPDSMLQDTRKKIVFVEYYNGQFLTAWPYRVDYSWADLVVCFDSEYVASQEGYYRQAARTFTNANVIFITGGLNVKDYNAIADARFFHPYLAFFHRVVMGNYNIRLNWPDTRPYLFDALLGGKKFHRLFVFDKLKQTNLLDQSIVALKTTPFDTFLEDAGDMTTPPNTWRKRPPVEDYYSTVLNELEDSDMLEFKRINKQLTALNSSRLVPWRFYKDSDCNIQLSIIISPKVYDNSWYSIISETTYGPFMFITEKTAKPLFCKRIFVSFSYCGHLKFVRSLGFRTFDGIIDESYDEEPDHDRRLAQAWQQVEFLASQDPVLIYQQAKEILEHNYQKMLTITHDNIADVRQFINSHLEKI